MTVHSNSHLPTIAVFNFGGVRKRAVQVAVDAVNGQILEDFLPIWRRGRVLEVYASAFDPKAPVGPPVESICASGVIYLVRVETLKAALGYHDLNAHHLPVGFVLVEVRNWSINLSHQVLEMIIDPMANSFVWGPSHYLSAEPVLWAYDICEPVEDTAYRRNGVLVSNFVTPSYFEVGSSNELANDFLSIGLPPFGVLPGGQTSYMTSDGKRWWTRSGINLRPEGLGDLGYMIWASHHHPKPKVRSDEKLEKILAEYNKNPAPGCKGFSNPLFSVTRLYRYKGLADREAGAASTRRVSSVFDAPLAHLANRKDDLVHFSITCPRTAQLGSSVIVDVWAHLSEQRDQIIKLAQEQTGTLPLAVKTKGPVPVEHGSIVTVQLSIPSLNVLEPEDTILWEGEIGCASFTVAVPPNTQPGTHPGTVYFRIRGILIAKTAFGLDVANAQADKEVLCANATATMYQSAFASYAHSDRDAVLECIQGMQKVAPQLKVFLDVASLRSGQNWKAALEQAISTKDVFYLFWSSAAKASKWVRFEWRLALRKRGIEFIDPVPLASPELVPPPKELSSLHFNDWTLAFKAGASSQVWPVA